MRAGISSEKSSRRSSGIWAFYNVLCVPSQKGRPLVCLQQQKNLRPDFSAVHCTVVTLVPLWLQSQRGCVLESPQAPHQFSFPASTITASGSFWAILGAVIRDPFDVSWSTAALAPHPRLAAAFGQIAD